MTAINMLLVATPRVLTPMQEMKKIPVANESKLKGVGLASFR